MAGQTELTGTGNMSFQPTPQVADPRKDFEIAIAKYVPSKRDLLTMLKFTPFGETYEIEFEGTKQEATRHVSSMRTHLSRFRAEVEAKGQTLRRFKVTLVGLEQMGIGKWKIILKKHQTDDNIIREDVGLVLKELGVG